MDIMHRLIEGYKSFFQEYFSGNNSTYKELAEGQFPRALVIACSDSRVDPSIVTKAAPGEIFVIRNVANLVPPYQLDSAYHGTSAALEFAVRNLQVEHIIVLGHTKCAGIFTLMQSKDHEEDTKSFIRPWVKIADRARKTVSEQYQGQPIETQSYHCEEEAIKISLQNLLTFPWIQEKVEQGALTLHGWHFDVSSGLLCTYDDKVKIFKPLPIENVKSSLSHSKPLVTSHNPG